MKKYKDYIKLNEQESIQAPKEKKSISQGEKKNLDFGLLDDKLSSIDFGGVKEKEQPKEKSAQGNEYDNYKRKYNELIKKGDTEKAEKIKNLMQKYKESHPNVQSQSQVQVQSK